MDHCDGASKAALVPLASSGVSSGSPAGVVTEECIEVDLVKLANGNIQVLGYSVGVALYTGMDAVERAQTKLGEAKYNIFFNNCESFVNWAITDKAHTNQGDIALGAGIVLTVGVVGAAVAGLVGLLYAPAPRKRKD